MSTRISLDYDRFAVMMCMDRDHSLEPYPEPFRGQGSLELVLPYEEYLRFLQDVDKNINLLYTTPPKALAAPLKSYYIDMAFAVCKEIYFSEMLQATPTKIYHLFPRTKVSRPPIGHSQVSDLLKETLANRNFLPYQISSRSLSAWDYACSLFACGYSNYDNMWNII